MTNVAESEDSPACWIRRDEVVVVQESERKKFVEREPSRFGQESTGEWIITIQMKSGPPTSFFSEKRRASDFVEILFP